MRQEKLILPSTKEDFIRMGAERLIAHMFDESDKDQKLISSFHLQFSRVNRELHISWLYE